MNGGGRIEREYGLGRGRTDLLVLWPGESGQPYDLWRRFVIECKVLRDSDRRSLEATIERGMEQTLGYMEKCSAEEGHLVVFDRREPSAGERESPAPRMEEPSDGSARGASASARRLNGTDAEWPSGRCSRRSAAKPPQGLRLNVPQSSHALLQHRQNRPYCVLHAPRQTGKTLGLP